MTLDDEVRLIVSNTLKLMPQSWRKAALKENCFCTIVYERQHYIMVDFTRTGIPQDVETYKQETMELYYTFKSIQKWYEV